MSAKTKKQIVSAVLALTVFAALPQYGFAETIQPNQIDLAVARACHLYDSGRLKEALAEFETILSQDPANRAAREYIKKISSRIDASGASMWEINEAMVGYKNALLAKKKIEITDQEKYVSYSEDRPYERFVNRTSFGYNDRHFETNTDKSFSPDGFFIAEHIRMDTVLNDWRNTFSLDARYHDNSHEDARIRRLTYAISNPGGLRFIVGDTSTRLSRYTLRGLYYRGVNLSTSGENNEFKVLWGAVPRFMAKTTSGSNKDYDIYIYPRKVFGAQDIYKVMEGYKVGVSFMELRDSERVRTIDSNYNPKLNRVVAIHQSIDAVPDTWKIETENAYSISDEDRTDEDILIGEEKLKDAAHYIRSAIEVRKFRLINSYERIGSDFRSYSDLATTTSVWLSGIASDREKIDNYLEYRPFDFDPVYLDVYFSRVRSNLDKDNDIEMNQQINYGTSVRYMPEECDWFPRSAVRVKFMDTLSVPGSEFAANEVVDRDIIFELAKRLYGIDLETSYTNRKMVDNIDTFGTYTGIYSIRAAKELTDMVLLSSEYSHSDARKDQDGSESRVAEENYFNVNTALRLWAGANLSLGYAYEDDTDITGTSGDTKTDTYSATFSWPFTKYFLRNGSEIILTPYFTYQLANGRSAESKDRYIWTSAVDATYMLAKDHRVSINVYYRDDQNYYEDTSTGSSSTQIEDYRFLLTYQKIFQ